ncbi:uncharacterized protein SCHCODRAFT_01037821 [Schizophyllum commune H4-8]|uniref:Expressed protein n=1 Tax=Schizophyllum commune (strain H4-8 / FGSC 9210) TaxID=578458 RepID=D8Q2S3_SCHCM|nr:uncharacterized protein SCHCODRAFT_01037821 [Schizophyllum commune H4-8]KAI5894581.1 hypothetical protein SCHCODRAFT_01037821 [Schizophyllum commune H4-8]
MPFSSCYGQCHVLRRLPSEDGISVDLGAVVSTAERASSAICSLAAVLCGTLVGLCGTLVGLGGGMTVR